MNVHSRLIDIAVRSKVGEIKRFSVALFHFSQLNVISLDECLL